MSVVKSLVDFYIRASIHVAFAVVCWIGVTDLLLDLELASELYLFAFSGTIVGYNVVKFSALIYQKKEYKFTFKLILLLSFFAALAAFWTFFLLSRNVQIAVFLCFLAVIGYAIPIFANWPNFRNVSGLKIYIVSLCYVVVTVLIPVINSGLDVNNEVWYLMISRFLMIVVLVLIFDIIDLNTDSPLLKTIPQSLGVRKAKILASILLSLLFATQLLWISNPNLLFVNIVIVAIVGIFLWFASSFRPKYYSQLYLESLPMIWFGFLLILKYHYF